MCCFICDEKGRKKTNCPYRTGIQKEKEKNTQPEVNMVQIEVMEGEDTVEVFVTTRSQTKHNEQEVEKNVSEEVRGLLLQKNVTNKMVDGSKSLHIDPMVILKKNTLNSRNVNQMHQKDHANKFLTQGLI